VHLQTKEHIVKSIKYLLPLAALALAGVASAASRNTNSVVVHFGDLDLHSQAGVASLHKRIRSAAESVCSSLDTRILGLRDAYSQCVDEAVREGVAAIANPNLSSFHATQGKHPVLASN
jgi:UrcA family protein